MNPFKKLREGLGRTQQQMAVELGKTVTTVSNWETYKTFPSLVEADALARGYHVKTEQIERAIVECARQMKQQPATAAK